MVFSIEALESYQAGDIDTANINAGLTLASAANLRLYVQSFRAIRAARAAVIAGETAAIGRGVSVVPHLATRALGWTLLIVGGVIARQYTQDTLLETWVKRTRFGIRPADWADSYEQSMTELYRIVFPISFQAYRLNELNPYRGMQTIHLCTTAPTGQGYPDRRDDPLQRARNLGHLSGLRRHPQGRGMDGQRF